MVLPTSLDCDTFLSLDRSRLMKFSGRVTRERPVQMSRHLSGLMADPPMPTEPGIVDRRAVARVESTFPKNKLKRICPRGQRSGGQFVDLVAR